MPWYVNSLFGDAAAANESGPSLWPIHLLVAVGVLAVSFFLGAYLAKKLRMPDHGWKIGVILFSVLASVAVLSLGPNLKLGIDLRGGVILVYQIEEKTKPADFKMEELIRAINRRVNPAGTKEVVIRPYGTDEIEVIDPIDIRDPEASKAEVDQLKRMISSQGSLQFRILANTHDDKDLIERALAEPSKSQLYDASDHLVAWWVPVKKGQEASVAGNDIATRPREKGTGKNKTTFTEVLVVTDASDVTGAYLTKSEPGTDEEGKPCVKFNFNTTGGQKFGELTSEHQPDKISGFKYRLGIILDNELYSAPSINSPIYESGIITGNFSKEEVDFLVDVLNAGSLPAVLVKEPISELYSGATLGSSTITKSLHAMLIASILVPLFMLMYYRFSGIVAVLALVLNMLILFAIMRAFRAAFTLTGFAGLALTVGMAVDNNILVFERLREERDRGATLRMAIRNAFHRAGTTIIDCNLTHMIAATVLWFLGTDQLKGFAVTLWLGVVTSMYTSVFVSHVIFEIAEKRQWIRDVKMMRWIGHTSIDFMSWFPYCLTASVLITIMAIVVSFVRGKGLFDIDFTGGVSVQAVFENQQDPEDVRKALERTQHLPDLVVNDVQVADQPRYLQFLINTSEDNPQKVQDELKRVFPDKLAHNSLEFTAPETISAAAAAKKSTPPAEISPQKQVEPPKKGQSRRDLPSRSMLAFAGDGSLALALADEPAKAAAAKPAAKAPAGDAKTEAKSNPDIEKSTAAQPVESPSAKRPLREPLPSEAAAAKAAEKPAAAAADAFVGGSRTVLTFKWKVNYETVEQMLQAAMKQTGIGAASTHHEFSNPDYTEGERVPFQKWTLRIMLPPDKVKTLLAAMQKEVAASPIFPASSQIGSAVAGNTRLLAVYALVASWVCIIIYLWIRFQGVAFGLAAVVALVHDVFVMLGGIAISYYVADYLGFLLIDQFKINLTIVAAFLTIIGYSVNDTIVVFDRIREVRGKDPNVTRKMVNDSVNQTLSRTLLTSLTVFMVVVVLYFAGGEAVHGFAFALIIGVATGTYSSIYIAAPILLWLVGKRHHVAALMERD
jgi:SecD/SecF fusion protein